MKPALINQKNTLFQATDTCLPDTLLKNGSSRITNNKDNAKEKTTVNNDSLKNCRMICFQSEPIVFRIPTSFARFSLRAVLRFMKLIQASNKTNTPIIPNIQTY